MPKDHRSIKQIWLLLAHNRTLKTKRACPFPVMNANYSSIFYADFHDIKFKLISLATYGYFGSFCATHFGDIVPGISVQIVPLFGLGARHIGSICATLEDQVIILKVKWHEDEKSVRFHRNMHYDHNLDILD